MEVEEFIASNGEKPQHYELAVNVIEAKRLLWQQIDSHVKIMVGKQMKYTRTQKGTNRPFFNEFFRFDFFLPLNELLEQRLTINLMQTKKHVIIRKRLLGSVRMDLGTIWMEKGHQFFHKWAVLTNPNKNTSQVQGFLKLDLFLLEKGDFIRSPFQITDTDTIETNLLQPCSPTSLYQTTGKYKFSIYSASNFKNSFPMTLTSNSESVYSGVISVVVSFSGSKVSTTEKRNEKITFIGEQFDFLEVFPPMYQFIRISVKISGEEVCSKLLFMRDISFCNLKGFLPSFGPAYLHFYNDARFYQGSILLAIKTEKDEGVLLPQEKLQSVQKHFISGFNENDNFTFTDYVIFGVVFEVSMLREDICEGKNVVITMSMGDLGTSIIQEEGLFNTSVAMECVPNDEGFFSLKIGKLKPCLFLTSSLQDSRYRYYLSNTIEKMVTLVRKSLIKARKQMCIGNVALANEILLKVMEDLSNICVQPMPFPPGETKLDKARLRLFNGLMDSTIKSISTFHWLSSFHERFQEASKILSRIERLMNDPQESFPDVILSLYKNKNLIANCKIRSRDILQADLDFRSGKFCGKVLTLLLKPVDEVDRLLIHGKVDIFLWIGPKVNIGRCLEQLPQGNEILSDWVQLPHLIKYPNKIAFQCRAHIYQGQFELEDAKIEHFNPAIRVVMGNRSKTTQTIKQSVVPIWDEMLVFEDVILYRTGKYLKKHPPSVIIELINKTKGTEKLMGISSTLPWIRLISDSEPHPSNAFKLNWVDIYNVHNERIGELLAMFEYIEVRKSRTSLPSKEPDKKLKTTPRIKNEVDEIPPKPVLKPEFSHIGVQGERSNLEKKQPPLSDGQSIKNDDLSVGVTNSLIQTKQNDFNGKEPESKRTTLKTEGNNELEGKPLKSLNSQSKLTKEKVNEEQAGKIEMPKIKDKASPVDKKTVKSKFASLLKLNGNSKTVSSNPTEKFELKEKANFPSKDKNIPFSIPPNTTDEKKISVNPTMKQIEDSNAKSIPVGSIKKDIPKEKIASRLKENKTILTPSTEKHEKTINILEEKSKTIKTGVALKEQAKAIDVTALKKIKDSNTVAPISTKTDITNSKSSERAKKDDQIFSSRPFTKEISGKKTPGTLESNKSSKSNPVNSENKSETKESNKSKSKENIISTDTKTDSAKNKEAVPKAVKSVEKGKNAKKPLTVTEKRVAAGRSFTQDEKDCAPVVLGGTRTQEMMDKNIDELVKNESIAAIRTDASEEVFGEEGISSVVSLKGSTKTVSIVASNSRNVEEENSSSLSIDLAKSEKSGEAEILHESESHKPCGINILVEEIGSTEDSELCESCESRLNTTNLPKKIINEPSDNAKENIIIDSTSKISCLKKEESLKELEFKLHSINEENGSSVQISKSSPHVSDNSVSRASEFIFHPPFQSKSELRIVGTPSAFANKNCSLKNFSDVHFSNKFLFHKPSVEYPKFISEAAKLKCMKPLVCGIKPNFKSPPLQNENNISIDNDIFILDLIKNTGSESSNHETDKNSLRESSIDEKKSLEPSCIENLPIRASFSEKISGTEHSFIKSAKSKSESCMFDSKNFENFDESSDLVNAGSTSERRKKNFDLKAFAYNYGEVKVKKLFSESHSNVQIRKRTCPFLLTTFREPALRNKEKKTVLKTHSVYTKDVMSSWTKLPEGGKSLVLNSEADRKMIRFKGFVNPYKKENRSKGSSKRMIIKQVISIYNDNNLKLDESSKSNNLKRIQTTKIHRSIGKPNLFRKKICVKCNGKLQKSSRKAKLDRKRGAFKYNAQAQKFLKNLYSFSGKKNKTENRSPTFLETLYSNERDHKSKGYLTRKSGQDHDSAEDLKAEILPRTEDSSSQNFSDKFTLVQKRSSGKVSNEEFYTDENFKLKEEEVCLTSSDNTLNLHKSVDVDQEKLLTKAEKNLSEFLQRTVSEENKLSKIETHPKVGNSDFDALNSVTVSSNEISSIKSSETIEKNLINTKINEFFRVKEGPSHEESTNKENNLPTVMKMSLKSMDTTIKRKSDINISDCSVKKSESRYKVKKKIQRIRKKNSFNSTNSFKLSDEFKKSLELSRLRAGVKSSSQIKPVENLSKDAKPIFLSTDSGMDPEGIVISRNSVTFKRSSPSTTMSERAIDTKISVEPLTTESSVMYESKQKQPTVSENSTEFTSFSSKENLALVEKGSNILRIPEEIRPILKTTRVEILFWGLRNMKKKLTKPFIVVTFGSKSIQSKSIYNVHTFPNFTQAPVKLDVELPIENLYLPSVTIKLYSKSQCFPLRYRLRAFCTFSNLHDFKANFIPVEKWNRERLVYNTLVKKKQIAYTEDIKDEINLELEPLIERKEVIKIQMEKPKKIRKIKVRFFTTLDKFFRSIYNFFRKIILGIKRFFVSLDHSLQAYWIYYLLRIVVKIFWLYFTIIGSYSARICRPCVNLFHVAKDLPEDIFENDEPLPSYTEEEEIDDWWTKYFNSIHVVGDMKKKKFWHKNDKGALVCDCCNESATDCTKVEKKDVRKPCLMIYNHDLEKQPQFKDFQDFVKKFYMHRSRKSLDQEVSGENATVVFKGALYIYPPVAENHYVTSHGDDASLGLFHHYPENKKVSVFVRVYVVRAYDLHSQDLDEKVDAYINIFLGKRKVADNRSEYVPSDLHPIFGKCFEVEAKFPRDSFLTVQLMDYDRFSKDDLIGETTIDLEARFYSKHYACCGLSQVYFSSGPNTWRDYVKPTDILQDLCEKHQAVGPNYFYSSVVINSKQFFVERVESDNSDEVKENMALAVLHRWQELPFIGYCLTPEHIETRSLFTSEKPGVEQGQIELWVDIFLKTPSTILPPAINLEPRKPQEMQLRVIIFRTANVLMMDEPFFSDRHSDIYIKGWLIGKVDTQKTDVHYYSLTGEGNFNWRFIFNFLWVSSENMILVFKEKKKFHHVTHHKIPPRLHVQVWDKDKIFRDDFIGSLEFDLTKIPKPVRSARKCNLEMMKEETGGINLFGIKRLKGWWPLTNIEKKTKKKILAGSIEVELELVSGQEAKKFPVGFGHDEPSALPMPDRPETAWNYFTGVFSVFSYVLIPKMWSHKGKLISILLTAAVVFFFILFVYSFPGYTAKKILGA